MSTSARSLLWAALLVALVGGVVQWLDPTSPILTGSDRSMEQYESFRSHVARDGAHDLVVLGNSVARQGVDIQLLREELEKRLGRPFLAYNFAAGGTSPAMLSYMADLVYGIDRPRFVIIVVTPRMAGAEVRQGAGSALGSSPYGVALHDPVRWRGALRRWGLDHVAILSLRYGLRDRLLGEKAAPRNVGGYHAGAGFRAAQQKDEDEQRWDLVSEAMIGWKVTDEEGQVLAGSVRRLQSYGAEVWLVQAPVHPRRWASLPDPAAGMAQMGQVIRRVAERTGAQYLLLPGDLGISGSDFADTAHLNAAGAERYTLWLADELRFPAPSRDRP